MDDGDGCCDFDPYEDGDDEESYHFKRTCGACGVVWWSLHCVHDGVQWPCPSCGHRHENRPTPLEKLRLVVPHEIWGRR